jgi:hypothetical protein
MEQSIQKSRRVFGDLKGVRGATFQILEGGLVDQACLPQAVEPFARAEKYRAIFRVFIIYIL